MSSVEKNAFFASETIARASSERARVFSYEDKNSTTSGIVGLQCWRRSASNPTETAKGCLEHIQDDVRPMLVQVWPREMARAVYTYEDEERDLLELHGWRRR
jgi:hypothetical protein